jgi:nitrous oxidase accessory protein NosD
VVVSDEASLTAALFAADPGDVIAIDGLLGIASDAVIASEGVTLTCATPGSGLYALPARTVSYLLRVVASGVTVDRLVLDAHGAGLGPILARGGQEEVRILRNMVTCGPDSCAFFVGGVRAAILDNYFEAAGSATGVHLQAGVDGARVEGNTVVTTAPSGASLFGGIRLLRGVNVSVSHNVVIGPWQNSIALTNIRESRVESNRVEGALRFGLTTEPRPRFPNTFFRGNTVRSNKMTSAGVAGILALNACSNVFVGNNLGGNADDTGIIFSSTTGANTYVGNGSVVIDNGNFDCDGDGVPDPNVITGRRGS